MSEEMHPGEWTLTSDGMDKAELAEYEERKSHEINKAIELALELWSSGYRAELASNVLMTMSSGPGGTYINMSNDAAIIIRDASRESSGSINIKSSSLVISNATMHAGTDITYTCFSPPGGDGTRSIAIANSTIYAADIITLNAHHILCSNSTITAREMHIEDDISDSRGAYTFVNSVFDGDIYIHESNMILFINCTCTGNIYYPEAEEEL